MRPDSRLMVARRRRRKRRGWWWWWWWCVVNIIDGPHEAWGYVIDRFILNIY